MKNTTKKTTKKKPEIAIPREEPPKPVEDTKKMTEVKMEHLLAEWTGTDYFRAFQVYIRKRASIIEDVLRGIDFFKEPTNASRYQGYHTGLFDPEDAALLSKKKADEEAKKAEEEAKRKKEQEGSRT